MIITHILGGLGNQMFQYAAGLAVAEAKGQSLYLDVSDFAGYRLYHGFELPRVFKGTFNLADESQIQQVLGWRSKGRLRTLLRRPQLGWLRSSHFVVEPHFHFWPELSSIADECYVVGYWQSEKYFGSIKKAIRRAFTFSNSLQGRNRELAERIAACNAISLHIRRGDYVSDPRTNATHGLLPLTYYHRAVQYIAERVSEPVFFVFSDDTAWAKAHLVLGHPCEFIGHNRGQDSHIDMQVMSLCDHHIIANSSFSWWGAWLNAKSQKIVVCPRRWFRRDDVDIRDLFPAEWIMMDG